MLVKGATAQSYKHCKNKTWYITTSNYAEGHQRSQWLIVLGAMVIYIIYVSKTRDWCSQQWSLSDLGWKLLNRFPPFRYFPIFSPLWKHTLAFEYHVNICKVPPQLSSAAAAVVKYSYDSTNLRSNFARSKILLTNELTNGDLVTPTPWCHSVLLPNYHLTQSLFKSNCSVNCEHIDVLKNYPSRWFGAAVNI